ncbi:MAG: universal stress protein [Paracoccaceae bacterium]
MRKFLVVMDDSPEFLNALRFAAIRAKKTGGGVSILGVVAPEEFQHWVGVGEVMRAEARERIEEHFKVFSKWMIDKEGFEPELVIREGEKATEVLAAIEEDPEVGVLVLGAGATGEGPGPLVTQLVARQTAEMSVPITVVPGGLTKDRIIAVS